MAVWCLFLSVRTLNTGLSETNLPLSVIRIGQMGKYKEAKGPFQYLRFHECIPIVHAFDSKLNSEIILLLNVKQNLMIVECK